MKRGYSQAAWRLFQQTLANARPERVLTWADTELSGTPFQRVVVPLPIVRPKNSQ